MSHRYKRSKPLGKSRPNTKPSNAELLKELQTEQGSAETGIVDFLYVDKARVSVLYAQLFPEGILTNVRTTSQKSSTTDRNFGSDVKVLKADLKKSSVGLEGIEHQFDASWSVPLEVLDELGSRSLIRQTLSNAKLGSVILQAGVLRIIDYSSMKELWEPTAQLGLLSNPKNLLNLGPGLPHILEIMKKLPDTLHAHILTEEAFLWSTLRHENLTISADDITLKYGGEIVSGNWQFLFVLDAYPNLSPPVDSSGWSGGGAAEAVRTMMAGIKQQIGRPSDWWAVTPLMIYRQIREPAVVES